MFINEITNIRQHSSNNQQLLVETILRSTGTGTESVPVLPILIFTRTRTRTRTGISAQFKPVPVTVLPERKVSRTRSFFRTLLGGTHPYPFLTRT